MKHKTLMMTTKEKAAWDRVKHAKVRAADSAILSFVLVDPWNRLVECAADGGQ